MVKKWLTLLVIQLEVVKFANPIDLIKIEDTSPVSYPNSKNEVALWKKNENKKSEPHH